MRSIPELREFALSHRKIREAPIGEVQVREIFVEVIIDSRIAASLKKKGAAPRQIVKVPHPVESSQKAPGTSARAKTRHTIVRQDRKSEHPQACILKTIVAGRSVARVSCRTERKRMGVLQELAG
jgi:hypothetical protein